jgi:hypothetical protein
MMASLLNFVDHPRQKQLLLGWTGEETVDVRKVSAYRQWDAYFSAQREPGIKYEQTGLKAWLEELKTRGILQGYEVTQVRELSSNAATLLAGRGEGSGQYEQEGIILFGYRGYTAPGKTEDKQFAAR